MKKRIKPFENYLADKQKGYILVLALSFFMGIFSALDLVRLLALIGFLVTAAIFLAKKGFIASPNGFYQGLMVGSFIFHKEKIYTTDFESVLIFENKAQQDIPLWTGLTIDMFINDNAYILYLGNEKENKKVYLMSFKEKEAMENAVLFLRNNTKLKIEFVTDS